MVKLNELSTGAHKHLDGKKKLHLAPPEMIEAWVMAAEIGQWKGYGERDWEKGIPFSVIEASIVRHLHAIRKREPINIEISNKNETRAIHHAFQLLWNVAALVTFILRHRDDLDDINIIPEYKCKFDTLSTDQIKDDKDQQKTIKDVIGSTRIGPEAYDLSKYMYGVSDASEL